VCIGISPAGDRVGVQLGKTTLENLAQQIKDHTEPPQYPSITVEGDEEAAVVMVRIEESPIKPVWAFGRPYKRVGRTNQRLSPEETQRLVEITTGRTWDALPCLGLERKHLDRQTVVDFLHRAGLPLKTSTDSVLENLRLLTPEGLCHGAALLFARNPQRFVTGSQVKCGRFLGTTSVDFLDQQTFDGNVLAQFEAALAFVARNTRQGIRITGRPEREIIPEYPDEAVREAVINAICHRNYAAAGTVQVRIYDDRLEVWNPGRLPPDLTIEELYREHSSHPRNRLLADALYRARLIEHWGTGTLRIIQACEAAGLPRPTFSAEMGTFIVRFEKLATPVEPAEALDLSERQRRAVAYVREHGRISTAEYRALAQLGERQARKDLSALVSGGVLVRKGKGRTTYYILSKTRLVPD
jgi:ATP-dependent DNA helicase RecG